MKLISKLKNNKFGIFAILILIAIIFFSSIYVFSCNQDHGKNPIDGIAEERSQILLTGNGYSMNYEQEQEYLKEEEKRHEIIQNNQEQIARETGNTHEITESIQEKKENEEKKESIIEDKGGSVDNNSSSDGDGNKGSGNGGKPSEGSDSDKDENGGSGGKGPGNGNDGDNTGGNIDESKLPTIICSLENGQEISGNFLGFTVKGISYKKEVISSFNMNVLANGNRLGSTGENSDGSYSFKTSKYLQDGLNEIAVTVTDKDGNTATKKYLINVDINGERPRTGTVRVILDARTVGKGILMDLNVPLYDQDNAYMVVDRAFKQAGITPVWQNSTNEFGGVYLASVIYPGIFANWTYDLIPAPLKEKLDDEGVTEQGIPSDINKIGEKDIYQWSGWCYDIDGTPGDFTENGMAVEQVDDRDVITVAFTLHMVYEFNGTWFSRGEW